MNNFTYYNPVNIVFGNGSFGKIPNIIGDRKVLLLTSQGFTKRGVVDKVKSLVKNVQFVIDKVPPNPTFKDLSQLYGEVKHNEIDAIVALGGGSVIDSAKVLSVYYSNQGFNFIKELIKTGQGVGYKLIPIIAIPTTSGTSSEITPWATVWDTEEKKKYSLHLKDLWCETAIYDPCLTVTLPKEITIQTGLDALSHSFESLWNKNANFISRDHAIYAIKEILDVLPEIVNDLSNVELRERMMYATVKAGLSFSNTQTSIAHAISYYLTLNKGVPHGIACSITIPSIIRVIKGGDRNIDKSFVEIFGQVAVDKEIDNFFRKLNISLSLKDYGVNEVDITMIKDTLVNNQRAGNSIVNTQELLKLLGNTL